MDDKLLALLNDFRQRPVVFIGSKNLDRLITFIYGYIHGVYLESGVRMQFLPGFQDFVVMHYELEGNIHVFRHWSKIISFFNATEAEAFDEFYTLMDSFLESKD